MIRGLLVQYPRYPAGTMEVRRVLRKRGYLVHFGDPFQRGELGASNNALSG